MPRPVIRKTGQVQPYQERQRREAARRMEPPMARVLRAAKRAKGRGKKA